MSGNLPPENLHYQLKPHDGSYKLVQNEAAADERKRDGDHHVIVVPALDIQHYIEPVALAYERMLPLVNSVNVLRSWRAFKTIRKLRDETLAIEKDYGERVKGCHERLATPVGGGPVMDNAWFQAWSAAQGISALSRLTASHDGLNAALDRKSAYALACFSLYAAAASIILTTVFGFLSI